MPRKNNNSEFTKWKLKNMRGRRYAHFDYKLNLKTDYSQIWNYVSNPINVAKHGFYPFIHYKIKQVKYGVNEETKNKCEKTKEREIYYSSHIDRYIYSYYGFLLNQYYNQRLILDGIDDVSIAYRNNKDKDNDNIYFAKKAFESIMDFNNCFVIIGDFKNFFDELEHKYLKTRLLDMMNIESGRLPDDFYTVFKNITLFSYWELESLFSLNNIKVSMKNPESIKRAYISLNKKDKVLELEDFKKYKKEHLKKNRTDDGKIKDYGIPQGSAISAVLSNVYMIEFDKQITYFVKTINGGLYMRYSDDFIIILPKQSENIFEAQYAQIQAIRKSVPRLILESKKTQVFLYTQGEEAVSKAVQKGIKNNKIAAKNG